MNCEALQVSVPTKYYVIFTTLMVNDTTNTPMTIVSKKLLSLLYQRCYSTCGNNDRTLYHENAEGVHEEFNKKNSFYYIVVQKKLINPVYIYYE